MIHLTSPLIGSTVTMTHAWPNIIIWHYAFNPFVFDVSPCLNIIIISASNSPSWHLDTFASTLMVSLLNLNSIRLDVKACIICGLANVVYPNESETAGTLRSWILTRESWTGSVTMAYAFVWKEWNESEKLSFCNWIVKRVGCKGREEVPANFSLKRDKVMGRQWSAAY